MAATPTRSTSPRPGYMKPTMASDARSRRASSPSSSLGPAPSSTQEPPSSPRKDSERPNVPGLAFKKLFQRTPQSASKSKSASSSASPAALENLPSSKPAVARSSDAVLTADGRKLNGYGDARAEQEDRMGAEMARIAKQKGLVDDETARNWATPWHVRGELMQQWSNDIRDKYNIENGIVPEEVMSLEEALRIKAKKDADEEEFCAAFKAGFITEDGNLVATGAKFQPGMYTRHLKAHERHAQPNFARKASTKEEATKKDSLRKVQDGRVTEPTTPKPTPEMATIDETDPFLGQPTEKTFNEAPSRDAKKSASEGTTTDSSSSPGKKKSCEKDNDDDFCVLPLTGRNPPPPNYQGYKYYDLAALLRDRNIRSGGKEERCRNRLIQDDIYILTDQEDKRDAKNWVHSKRDVKTAAPMVPNMPNASPAAVKKARKKVMQNGHEPITHPYAPIRPVKATKRSRSEEEEDNDDQVVQPQTKKVKALEKA